MKHLQQLSVSYFTQETVSRKIAICLLSIFSFNRYLRSFCHEQVLFMMLKIQHWMKCTKISISEGLENACGGGGVYGNSMTFI